MTHKSFCFNILCGHSLAHFALELFSHGRLYEYNAATESFRLKVKQFAEGAVNSSQWKALFFVSESEEQSEAKVMLGQLLQGMLSDDPSKRPIAKEVEERLEVISEALSSTEVLSRCSHTAGCVKVNLCRSLL